MKKPRALVEINKSLRHPSTTGDLCCLEHLVNSHCTSPGCEPTSPPDLLYNLEEVRSLSQHWCVSVPPHFHSHLLKLSTCSHSRCAPSSGHSFWFLPLKSAAHWSTLHAGTHCPGPPTHHRQHQPHKWFSTTRGNVDFLNYSARSGYGDRVS